MKISLCPKCGVRFYTDYYDDGYIDHVMNFSDNSQMYIDEGVHSLVREITMSGNDVRSSSSIRSRLACFKTWVMQEQIKSDVVEKVEAILSTRKGNRKAIEKAIKSLTPEQKRELHHMVESEGYLRDAT